MTVIYADSSALIKRVLLEIESADVRAMLAGAVGTDVLTASALAWLEVWRSLRRSGIGDVDLAGEAALSGIAEIPLTDDVLRRSRTIGPDGLRSLDAIHLTSALVVGATVVLTYDTRMAQAAELLGFQVLMPGRG